MINKKDTLYLRELTQRYMDIANSDLMQVRKRQWTALNDLKQEKPMILMETISQEAFLDGYEFVCKESPLKHVEASLVSQLKQYDVLKDDIVFEPYFRIGWWGPAITALAKEFGDIVIEDVRAKEESMAKHTNFPVKTPDDIKKLRYRKLYLDRSASLNAKAVLDEIIGDILPVRLENTDFWYPDLGFQPFIGCNFPGLTWELFNLIGANAIMLWPYDHPNELHELMRFITDDKKIYYQYLLDNDLITYNADNECTGGASYGYTSELPSASVEHDRKCTYKDLWCWAESQESHPISPDMYAEFYLPYIAEIANMFGLTYLGCCDNTIGKFEKSIEQIHNIRKVSVSRWSDPYLAAELLGKNYVFCRRPNPALVSAEKVDWDLIKQEAENSAKAARNCNVEIVYRDIYSRYCTVERAAKFVAIWKNAFDI